jgi:hypothetical protein
MGAAAQAAAPRTVTKVTSRQHEADDAAAKKGK